MRKTAFSFILITALAILYSSCLFSQTELVNPIIIDIDDGLPSNFVTAIAKDNEGFMWFGTDNGLCRWDGISTKVYRNDASDTSSLANNIIEPDALLWDETQNKLLIGTSYGFSIYNPRSGTFNNYYPGKGGPLASGNRISALIKDRDGIIWLATDNGFVSFNPNLSSFKNYYYAGQFKVHQLIDTIKVNTILAISQDLNNDSVFWIGTRSGLLKFNKHTEEIKQFYYDYHLKNIEYAINIFRSVCPHPNGKLYLGTWTNGMTIFSTITETFINNFRPGGASKKESSYDGTVPPIKVKSDHEIWLPIALGLSVYDTETDEITFTKSYRNPAGKSYPIWLNLIDGQHRLWCGSRYGVYLFDKQNQQFDNFFFRPTSDTKHYITYDIFEDTKTGLIFMAEQGGDGLHYFDPESENFSFIKLPINPLMEITINSIFQTSDGVICIVSPYGLFKLSNDRKKLLQITKFEDSYPWLKSMVEDKYGNIWISSLNNGLQQVDLKSGKLEKAKNWRSYFESDRNVPDILHLHVDRDNRIWFIRQYGGYGYYDRKKDTVCYFFMSDSNDNNFYHLTCFAQGKDNIIWAGDWENGLGFIDPDYPGKGVQTFSPAEKRIQSGTVYNIRLDGNNRLWMLTRAGLEMFDPSTGQNTLFNQNDGLIVYDTFFNRNSYIPGSFEKLSDGRMVVGYRRGLGFFYPDSLIVNDEVPIPYLSSLKVFEKELSSENELFYTNHIDLKYHQNFLTFEYSAISLGLGNNINFFHQLEGVDRDWIQSSRRFASYSNLAPGKYIYRVKVQSKYKIWSEKPLIFEIVIHPPWWKTWWAYLMYVLFVGGALFGFYRFQLNRQVALRETSRLKELDDIKSQLYANITHEFRTPLTVITGMADEIKSDLLKGDQKRLDDFLDMIRRNAGKLLHLVNQMLDLSKLESGKLELKPVQADVAPYLQYITESFQSFAESQGIKLVFYNETEEVIMDHDPDKLFTIISNLLSNAIKFTLKGGKVICHLNISGKPKPESLILKVKDTGIGIGADALPNIFNRFFQADSSSTRQGEGTGIGLSLTKELVELMDGRIEVKSQVGKGSEFIVQLPITRNAQLPDSKTDKKQTHTEILDKLQTAFQVELMGNKLSGPKPTEADELPITLIVEDNEDVAKYIALSLGDAYQIHHAHNGQEGIDQALELIPDIIICDVMMPIKDGYEVCAFLKQDERTSHVPIIMLTAKATKEDRIEGLIRGADAYLPKPFDKEELLVRMEKLIHLRKHLHEKFSGKKYALKRTLSADNIEDQFLQKAISKIEKNIDDSEFGTSQLAKLIGMSESQLYRKLKALTGKSTAVFIRVIRLNKAAELLKTSELNISEIAYETGFNDPAWFSRAFKDEFGKSPLAYRDD